MRWTGLIPPVLAVTALLVAAGSVPGTVGAADPPWDPPPCDMGPGSGGAAGGSLGAVAARLAAGMAGPGVPWFRLDGVLDDRGTLDGRRLATGDATAGTRRRTDLAPESFAAGPFGRLVLAGSDDGRRSTLRLIDPIAACAIEAGDAAPVIRSALLAADGTAVVEHRVDRRTRADLGIWRRPIDGTAPIRILEPLEADARYGPTFATELAWGTDGRLAVASCGQTRCRARVLDGTTGTAVGIADVGPLVGLSGDLLVVHQPCAGLPCPIEAIAVGTGLRRVLAADAGLAVLGGTAGDRLVWERLVDGRIRLLATELATGHTVDLGAAPDGHALQTSPGRAASGLGTPDGWVATTPDGRVPLDVGRGRARLLDPRTGIAASVLGIRP